MFTPLCLACLFARSTLASRAAWITLADIRARSSNITHTAATATPTGALKHNVPRACTLCRHCSITTLSLAPAAARALTRTLTGAIAADITCRRGVRGSEGATTALTARLIAVARRTIRADRSLAGFVYSAVGVVRSIGGGTRSGVFIALGTSCGASRIWG